MTIKIGRQRKVANCRETLLRLSLNGSSLVVSKEIAICVKNRLLYELLLQMGRCVGILSEY